MNTYPPTEIKRLNSESLRENQNSYVIQELFQTTTELLEASEQQLTMIKGIGLGKARQITALLQLAKALIIPSHDQVAIQRPKDVYDLLAPDLRHAPKEHFTCLFLNTKNRVIHNQLTLFKKLVEHDAERVGKLE
ncbi:JAB domain-containing protein [Paenibacillus sp. 2TAB26]|uniref:JAB domain-containing protein n=1 Tax=Paenibacillus sp. 2TAB26 TaxID=3233005 RepID=UPI003F9B7EF5